MLVVRLDAIGDALTTVPLIAALRRRGVRVGAVLRRQNAEIFAARALDEVYLAEDPALVEAVRRGGYACALIPTEKPLAYRIARAAGIPSRIGFENGWGKPLKTLWVRRMCTQTVFRTAGLDPRAPHECEVVFKLAQTLLPDAEPPRDPAVLRPLVLDEPAAGDERIALQLTDKWERLGASPESVVRLADTICAHHAVRLIGSAAEEDSCRRLAERIGRPVELFASLRDWKAAIAACRAIVAPDSGAIHVAGMIGTPVVACFANAGFALQSARWAPWAAPQRIVQIEGEMWPAVAADALEFLLTGKARAAYKG